MIKRYIKDNKRIIEIEKGDIVHVSCIHNFDILINNGTITDKY